MEPRSLTSDRIVGKSSIYIDEFMKIELVDLKTEKGNKFTVDQRRFSDIDVGDQIDIFLTVTKK